MDVVSWVNFCFLGIKNILMLFLLCFVFQKLKKKKGMLLTLLEIKIIKWHLTEFSDFYSFLNQTYDCYIILNICET